MPVLRPVFDPETYPHAIDPNGTKSRVEWQRRFRHWLRTNGRCWYCGDEITVDNMHLDHVVARSSGGRGNLVPTCEGCNCAKGPKSVEEFRSMRIRQRDNVPYFSPQQKEWLDERGFAFPTPEPYVFWFETEGLV